MVAALGMTVEIVKPVVCGYNTSAKLNYLSDVEPAKYGNKK